NQAPTTRLGRDMDYAHKRRFGELLGRVHEFDYQQHPDRQRFGYKQPHAIGGDVFDFDRPKVFQHGGSKRTSHTGGHGKPFRPTFLLTHHATLRNFELANTSDLQEKFRWPWAKRPAGFLFHEGNALHCRKKWTNKDIDHVWRPPTQT